MTVSVDVVVVVVVVAVDVVVFAVDAAVVLVVAVDLLPLFHSLEVKCNKHSQHFSFFLLH